MIADRGGGDLEAASAGPCPHRRRLPGELDEEDDDGDDERVNRDRLGESGADDHGRSDLTSSFGIASDRFHRAADGHTDTKTWANSTQSNCQGRADCLGAIQSLWSRKSVEHVTFLLPVPVDFLDGPLMCCMDDTASPLVTEQIETCATFLNSGGLIDEPSE